MLSDSARDLFKAAPVALVRELRDQDNEVGYSQDLWKEMVEMGLNGLLVSEENGGMDFGWRGMGVILEECGRTLSNSPVLTTAVAAHIIDRYGSEEQKAMLTEIITGGKSITIALRSTSRMSADECIVTADGDHYLLSGTKQMVANANTADYILLSALSDGVEQYYLIENSDAVQVETERYMDSRMYSRLSFDSVKLSQSALVGVAKAQRAIATTLISGLNALLSAELLGLMTEAFERTVGYLKERRQFGVLIGSFQALQHRAADLYSEIELVKSIVIKALDALDDGDPIATAYCSMAKAKASKIAQLATNEGVQMYGGIGMTDDEEIGFFMKRARVAAEQFGSMSYHADRFARLSSY